MKKSSRKISVDKKMKKRLSINRPTAYAIIKKGHYAALISAAPGDTVEIAVDGGAWEVSAFASGYWRVQLGGLVAGEHRLAARVIKGNRVFVAL